MRTGDMVLLSWTMVAAAVLGIAGVAQACPGTAVGVASAGIRIADPPHIDLSFISEEYRPQFVLVAGSLDDDSPGSDPSLNTADLKSDGSLNDTTLKSDGSLNDTTLKSDGSLNDTTLKPDRSLNDTSLPSDASLKEDSVESDDSVNDDSLENE